MHSVIAHSLSVFILSVLCDRLSCTTRVEGYGHRILQERSAKITGSCRKAPEIAGSGSSILTGKVSDFFQWIPINFLCSLTRTDRKSSEKIRKISGGNTGSTFHRFPVLFCRNQPVFFDLGNPDVRICVCLLIVAFHLFFRSALYLCSRAVTLSLLTPYRVALCPSFLSLTSCHALTAMYIKHMCREEEKQLKM